MLYPSVEGEKTNCAAFGMIRLDVLQGISVEIFAQQNRRSDLPVFNIKQNLAKKLDPFYTKPKSFEGNNVSILLIFPHKTQNVHAIFER